ncbi:MAG: hypothetical protein ABW321_05190 [Polyangiales bacterium]
MVYLRMMLVSLTLAWSSGVLAQRVEPPVVLGTLAGASSPQQPSGLQLYGTDRGVSFFHAGEIIMLFGDSWRDQNAICSYAQAGLPRNDDAQAILPLPLIDGVPELQFVTQSAPVDTFQPVQLLREGSALPLGLARAPIAGWSDSRHAVAVFQTQSQLACTDEGEGKEPSCAEPFVCNRNVGACQPVRFGVPQLCDVEEQAGCSDGQACVAEPLGYCTDPTSTQTAASRQVPVELALALQRPSPVAAWESKFTFATNKFSNLTARAIERFGDRGVGADYRPGYGALLIWGRPGISDGAGLYLMAHDLPIPQSVFSGDLEFEPYYFAGLDDTYTPIWSEHEADARPLALDGLVAGDTNDVVSPVNQMAVTWLGAPINRWIMIYGGGSRHPVEGDVLPTGALAVRFAEQPWGPWSTPETLWDPGSPTTPNTPLGPGGVLYHPECVSQLTAACAAGDPVRPEQLLADDCASAPTPADPGFFYAPNIIDFYTRPNDKGGLDVYWNVSTWNPYRVLLVRSSFNPP